MGENPLIYGIILEKRRVIVVYIAILIIDKLANLKDVIVKQKQSSKF